MTQASLSPDLSGALSASPTDAHARTGQISESALWIMALTASGLLVASVLLIGVLARSTVTDASFGGFVSGVSIVIAAVGVGALTYVLVTVRRQSLRQTNVSKSDASGVIPRGMHVVPALPAEMGRRRRRQLQAGRSERSRQAKAIATATSAPAKARPVAPPVAKPRPASPHRATSARPVPHEAATTHPNARPATVKPGMRSLASTHAARPTIRMPQAQVGRPRPGAWPTRVPVVRMAAPPVMPRTRVAMQQVNAASVRLQAPTGHRQAKRAGSHQVR